MSALIDLTGKRFARLLVIGRATATGGQAKWECLCDCGAKRTVISALLRSGGTKSCGCLKRENLIARSTTHGMSRVGCRTPEYTAWANMIARCEDQNRTADWPLYGGRGITVCARWRSSFEAFLADIGRRPSARHSIDRIDTDGHYEPGNVRWAAPEVQHNNRRDNRIVQYRGERMTFTQAWRASERVVSFGVAHSRFKRGWPAGAAINTPTVPVRGRRAAGSRCWA